jgi:hypothetical protein
MSASTASICSQASSISSSTRRSWSRILAKCTHVFARSSPPNVLNSQRESRCVCIFFLYILSLFFKTHGTHDAIRSEPQRFGNKDVVKFRWVLLNKCQVMFEMNRSYVQRPGALALVTFQFHQIFNFLLLFLFSVGLSLSVFNVLHRAQLPKVLLRIPRP